MAQKGNEFKLVTRDIKGYSIWIPEVTGWKMLMGEN